MELPDSIKVELICVNDLRLETNVEAFKGAWMISQDKDRSEILLCTFIIEHPVSI